MIIHGEGVEVEVRATSAWRLRVGFVLMWAALRLGRLAVGVGCSLRFGPIEVKRVIRDGLPPDVRA